MKKNLHLNSHEELIELVATLSQRLKKRNDDLTLARHPSNRSSDWRRSSLTSEVEF